MRFVLFLCVVSLTSLFAREPDAGSSPKLDVCEFDFFLMDHFVHPELSKVSEVLDYLVENAPQVENELCKDKSKQKGLTYKAGQLYETHREGDAAIPKVHTRYFGFGGHVVNGRELTEEDNAAYNLVLDYLVSKYDMWYALGKKTALQTDSKLTTGGFLEYMLKYRVTPSSVADAASEVALTPAGIAASAATSWASLWIQKDSPYERDSYYNIDYSWLLVARDNFLARYPNSRYRDALNALIDEKIIAELYENDKKSGVLALGVGLSVGKTVKSSALDAVDEYVTFSLPNGRVQVYSFVFQIQVDILVANRITVTGLDALMGRTFEFDEYAFDVLAGLGFDEFYVGEDTTMYLAFMGGVQALRRLPLGDMAYIVPKLQWLLKTVKFDDPIKNRKRRAFLNQFSIGISFEGRQPLSRLNIGK